MMIYLGLLGAGLLLPAASLTFLHVFQLESYQLPGYYRYLRDHGENANRTPVLFAVIMAAVLAVMILGASYLPWMWTVCPILWIASFIGAMIRWKKTLAAPAKKPLAFTDRMKRLVLCMTFMGIIASAVLAIPVLFFSKIIPYVCAVLIPIVIAAPASVWTDCAARIMAPVEKRVNQRFLNDAARILRTHAPMIKIGITGSYGKTSTKMILQTILSEKYKTQCTPASYNTPMGVTRFVREQLEPDTEVFLAEMGARHVGDIRELCDLVHPDHGLLTSVGPQHLETFFTIENVAKTKYELAQSLPKDGIAFFPMDDGQAEQLYRHHSGKKISFGFPRDGEKIPDFSAKNISCSENGVHFTLVDPLGQEVECVSSLLGTHNVQNILGAAAVASSLGMSLDEIAHGIAKVQAVEHRLQLIRGRGGVTVIDDAFNSNPTGAKAAMDVLAAFPGRHIVVTPGLVEQGEDEYTRNREFGSAMAQAADLVILVAGNADAMKQGLMDEGYSPQRIHEAATLSEASQILATFARSGDVVLFENDLPDQYEAK